MIHRTDLPQLPVLGPPLGDHYGRGKVEAHCEETNEAKPQIEGRGEKDDGDDNVNYGRHDVEEDVTGKTKGGKCIW